jgi:5-methylcytosine-specific restriction endonuclease McrA
MKELKYSEWEADRRIQAMRLLAELPQLETKVENGELTLTNLAMAKRHFRKEEKRGPMSVQEKIKVMEKLENKSAREGEKILLAEASVPPLPVKERMRQVTAEITEIKFGADEKLLAKFKKLKGLMAHRKPNMNLAEFMDELCEMALEKIDPARKMPKVIPAAPQVWSTAVPTVKVGKISRRYVSVKTKREIWQKSEGKCQNCNSQFALEVDHIQLISQGGSNESQNLRILCRHCNQRAAIQKLGLETMHKYLDRPHKPF